MWEAAGPGERTRAGRRRTGEGALMRGRKRHAIPLLLLAAFLCILAVSVTALVRGTLGIR